MNVNKFETANSWFSAMHEEGYTVPVILCQAIEKIMKDKKVTFSDAYKTLDSKDLITTTDKVISYTSPR